MPHFYVFTLVFLFIIRCRFPRAHSLATIIRNRYGSNTLRLIRKYEKVDFKIRKIDQDISFLETCKDNDLSPTFLRYKMSSSRLRNSSSYKASQRLFLQEEITFKIADKTKLQIEFNTVTTTIRSIVSFIDWLHITNTITTSNEKAIKKVESVQNYKLSELMGSHLSHDPSSVIRNYSSHVLTDDQKSLLIKGLNFAMPPKKLKYQDYLLPYELLYRNVMNENEIKDSLVFLQSRIKDVGLSTFRLYNKKDHRFENLNRQEYDAFIELTNIDSIIIQKADKGNTVVLVDKDKYIQNMEEILSDVTKFVKVQFNPQHKVNKEIRHVLDMESAIKSCLDDLLENNYLSEEDHKLLNPVGSRPGIMYGLCKVHKDKTNGTVLPPFRPILSAIKTCSFSMAKFFVPLLKDFTTNEFSVKDSFSFAAEITTQDANTYMVSFDVESLFTNIPLDETIDICVNRVYHKRKKVKGLLKRHFKQLLTFATKSSCFVFNGVYYSQIDGVAMGSPLGPTLANLFLSYYEEKWLKECPAQFKPKFYRRYVDDVFLLFDSRDHVKKFLRYLNSRHANIKFTYEEEENDTLSFLDVNIMRENGKFTTSVFRKKTFSGVYLNFFSYLPIEYKKGLISTLLFRTFTLCSDYHKIHEEISRLKTIWQKNRFPLYFIDRCIKKVLDNLLVKKKPSSADSAKKKEVTIPLIFLGKISFRIKKNLLNIFRECAPGIRLKIVFSSPNRLRNNFPFKERLPREMNSMIIYKFTCSACNSTYIGETKRHFMVRSHEHMGISLLTNKPLSYNEKNATAVNKHCHDNSHLCTIDNFKIIGQATNKFHLRLKESFLISQVNPSIINVQKKSVPLCLFG